MDKSTVDPCNVCGNTDVHLVDGYYYCVECGTQDVNVRQTIIEERALADGTFLLSKKKKVHKVLEEKKEMSGEWYKWHAYNFILESLADELIALGAKQSFKMKVLWLWTRYVKKFQKKEELGLSKGEDAPNTTDEDSEEQTKKKRKIINNCAVMKKIIIFSILYSALNLDGSDIQMSDLLRYIHEGRLSISNCEKFVPKEINVALIPDWSKFTRSQLPEREAIDFAIHFLNSVSIPPRMPDLRLLVDRYIKELCLPNDFKDLVFSLMHLAPCDYLELDKTSMKYQARIPQYETVVMSYVVLALKMCFGLDDDYEIKLSDTVDKINDDNCYLKSYKLDTFSEPTDRLFSFREWCSFIQLRKIILSKYYLHISEEYFLDIDDYVFMEHMKTKNVDSKKPKISDEIVMNLLDKIPQVNKVQVIPKSDFKPTTTPLSTYTELILQYYNDPDLRLLLSEDFTQYSMKYATKDLLLTNNVNSKNMIRGINKTKKVITPKITGTFVTVPIDREIVYVRNCDNKNWIKTNQPTSEHIKIKNECGSNDKDSDHRCDSNAETVSSESEVNSKDNCHEVTKEIEECDKELEILKLEDDNVNIFDDDFKDLIEEVDIKKEEEETENNMEPLENIEEPIISENPDAQDSFSDNENEGSGNKADFFFNPKTFDRAKTIRELVLAECKKYKAKIPNEYNPKEPKKRKANLFNDKSKESGAKRRKLNADPNKTKRSSVKDEINDLLNAYYKNVQNDVLFQLSDHVKSVVSNVNRTREETVNESCVDNDVRHIPNDSISNETDSNLQLPENNETEVENLYRSESVQSVNEVDIAEEEVEKVDPRFDEKDHNIKQLYIEVEGANDSDDAFDIADDPEIAEIIDKKIKEIDNGKIRYPPRAVDCDDVVPRRYPPRAVDYDDDIPLSVFKKEKLSILKKKMEMEKIAKMKLDPLVRNRELKKFKYWTRFYVPKELNKRNDLNEVFHMDLNSNFPKSFYFVIKECSMIVRCTPFKIYKYVTRLEERIIL